MTYLFAPGNRATLTRFLASRVLLAFDFDGTLAPIVADRQAARMRRRTARLLDAVSRRYPCAVISGRRQEDVRQRLEGAPVRHVMGNHGLESLAGDTAGIAAVAELRRQLLTSLAGASGVEVEDKCHSLALHYRRARDRPRARDQIRQALTGAQASFRILPGKLVFDVLPRQGRHKGTALSHLCSVEGVEAAVYVGDDLTDEDVFRMADPQRLLPIRIGRRRFSAATHYLRDQRELDALLDHALKQATQRAPAVKDSNARPEGRSNP
jgi:trehalose 6-phosphate phosphatase